MVMELPRNLIPKQKLRDVVQKGVKSIIDSVPVNKWPPVSLFEGFVQYYGMLGQKRIDQEEEKISTDPVFVAKKMAYFCSYSQAQDVGLDRMLRFNDEGLLTHVRITWATEDRQGGSKMIEEKKKVNAEFQKMLKAVRKADTEKIFGEIMLYAEWFETAERDANLPKWT